LGVFKIIPNCYNALYNKFPFVTAKSIRNLEAAVRATVFGLTVTYPLPEPDACKLLIDSACPLEEGDLATYELKLPITAAIPQVSGHRDRNIQLDTCSYTAIKSKAEA
jgi:hypothetical protein